MSGMAGLYLNLLDIIFDTYAGTTELNETNHCAIKMAESVHFTAAQYITTQYYWQNSVCNFSLFFRFYDSLLKTLFKKKTTVAKFFSFFFSFSSLILGTLLGSNDENFLSDIV